FRHGHHLAHHAGQPCNILSGGQVCPPCLSTSCPSPATSPEKPLREKRERKGGGGRAFMAARSWVPVTIGCPPAFRASVTGLAAAARTGSRRVPHLRQRRRAPYQSTRQRQCWERTTALVDHPGRSSSDRAVPRQ